MLIKDLDKYLKSAVFLTCLALTLPMAEGSALAESKQPISTPQIQLSQSDSYSLIDATSMRGDSVVFISSESPDVVNLIPGINSGPMAAYLPTVEGSVACTVSDNPGMAANLGNRIIQIDSTEHGAVVEASLTRLTTTAHEYGHCLDMLSSQKVLQGANANGVSPYAVPAVAIDQAMKNGSGVIDVDWIASSTPDAAQEAVKNAEHLSPLAISLLEVYADLQGALQTASTTGDLRGFYDFELSIRMNNPSQRHTTSLSVAKILAAEQEAGFDANSLKGASFDTVNAKANQIFLKHFAIDGQLSTESQGFKDIVNEFQIKKMLGANIPPELSESLDHFSANGLSPTIADKQLYLDLMAHSLSHQKDLASKASAGNIQKSGVPAMLENLDDRLTHAHQTLGTEYSSDSFHFVRNEVSASDIQDSALDFYARATNLSSAIPTDTSGIADLLSDSRSLNGLSPSF